MIPNASETIEGAEVVIEGSIRVPAMQDATRAMGSEKINTLHLLVFDENGYLIQVAEGKKVDSFGTTVNTEYQFKATLLASNYKRTIHLIANSPKVYNETTNEYVLGEHERRVVKPLVTSGTNEAFWSYIVLENGITGTNTTIDGKQQFVPTNDVKAALTKVPMVRNYACATLTLSDKAAGEFTGVSMQICNVPNIGSIAPFISDGVYAEYATREGTTNTAETYENLTAAGFEGYEPTDVDGFQLVNTGWATTHYFFERHQTTAANPAYAIIKGTYMGSEYYYKVDFCYTDTVSNKQILYNLLRNMQFNIVVDDVKGTGFTSAAEAASSPASNNLSFAIETVNLLNMSDGVGRLSVEYTTKVVTSEAPFTLKYRFEPKIAEAKTDNGNVTITRDTTLAVSSKVISSYAIAEANDKDADGNDTGWRTITITPTAIQGYKEETIVLSATTTNSTITRQVTFKSVAPYQMSIDVPAKVASSIGNVVPVTLNLPTGLDQSLFPLEIIVLTNNSSLSSSYPVVTGLNSDGAPDANGQYFGYKVTIDADEYFVTDSATGNISNDTFNNVVELTGFKLNTALPVDTVTTVKAYNPNFNKPYDTFTVVAPYGLTLSITEFSSNEVTTQLNASLQKATADDWVGPDGNKHIDFDLSYSPNALTPTGVAINGVAAADVGSYANIVDGKLRVYQNGYNSKKYTQFEITFTSTETVVGTTITASHAMFGTASATVERYAVSWGIVGNNNNNNQTAMSNGTQYRLRIVLPAGISNAAINTLKITATTTRTTLSLNGQTITDTSPGTVDITSDMYDSSTGYIYVPITATTAANNNTRSFTLTLEGGDMFDLPGAITRTYSSSWGSYAYR